LRVVPFVVVPLVPAFFAGAGFTVSAGAVVAFVLESAGGGATFGLGAREQPAATSASASATTPRSAPPCAPSSCGPLPGSHPAGRQGRLAGLGERDVEGQRDRDRRAEAGVESISAWPAWSASTRCTIDSPMPEPFSRVV